MNEVPEVTPPIKGAPTIHTTGCKNLCNLGCWVLSHDAMWLRAGMCQWSRVAVLLHTPIFCQHFSASVLRRSSSTETWEAMEKLQDQGLVKAIGLSNFSVKKTTDVLKYARIKPAVQQVEIHPYAPLSCLCASTCQLSSIHVCPSVSHL